MVFRGFHLRIALNVLKYALFHSYCMRDLPFKKCSDDIFLIDLELNISEYLEYLE